MVWYSAPPSNLSPSPAPDPTDSFSAGLMPPHLRFRRATRAPLPDTVSFYRRQALIRSSPIKARQFLGESFNSRVEHYDKAGRMMIKHSEQYIELRKPKGKPLTKKELRALREQKKMVREKAKKAKAAKPKELSAIEVYNLKIAKLCEQRKREEEMEKAGSGSFDALIIPESPLELRAGADGHKLSHSYYAMISKNSTQEARRHRKKHHKVLDINGEFDVLVGEMEMLMN